jgi:hypothetical protein
MNRCLFALGLLICCSLAIAAKPDRSCYSAAEFDAWVAAIRGFDEIRMSLAHDDAILFEKAEEEREDPEGLVANAKPLFSAHVAEESARFVALAEFQTGVAKTAHGCEGLFNLRFLRGGKVVGDLHYAHGRYWFPLTSKSQAAINHWLQTHGFPIEDTLARENAKKG